MRSHYFAILIVTLTILTTAVHAHPHASVEQFAQMPESAPSPQAPTTVRVVNANDPGKLNIIERFIVPGKVNIFVFFSRHCAVSSRTCASLEEMVQANSEYAVHKVDIDRVGSKGIDWYSPLAQQFKVDSTPYFIVFNGVGQKIAEGKAAYPQVMEWIEVFKRSKVRE